ncbi:hypothetical protein JCM33374_g4506 [Metschnikowia sp. JCM 33374]|nr:hypothetical protein JCM33374_g4506 [Metschnikowia sp. JCM 33374]
MDYSATCLSPGSVQGVVSKAFVTYRTIKADVDGKYQYCFSNERSSRVDLDVSFNVHGVVYIDVSDPDSDTLDDSISNED